VFDGVHLGHQHLLRALVKEGVESHLSTGVITFQNHPMEVLVPGTLVPSITTIEKQVALIQELGIDFVIPITFTSEISKMKAKEFVLDLQNNLRMKKLIIGPDFALGHRRDGTPEILHDMGEASGFSVITVEPFLLDKNAVNSTAIRNAITKGDIRIATSLLGRLFTLDGKVVNGDGRGGNLLNHPTANLEVGSNLVIPGDGIYATWAYFQGERYRAATSIGVRPTFGSDRHTVESFILDYTGNLYGQSMKLEFVEYLREQVTFQHIKDLKEQIHIDVKQIRRLLKN
jgi:riboflavin kinase/FMN adenylyltransferase